MGLNSLISDEDCISAANAYREHKNQQRAAKACGLPRTTYQGRLYAAAQRGFLGYDPVLPGFSISETVVRQDGNGHITGRSIRQRAGVRGEFQVPEGHQIKGISALLDPNGNTVSQWIKTKKQETQQEETLSAIKAAFSEYDGRAELPPAPGKNLDKDLATVYVIGDHHLGMYAWAKETGDADYNLEIGADALREAMSELVLQAPSSDTAVVLGLGDFVHADNQANRTERSGNALDVDTRYAKVLQLGVEILISCVEMAAQKHRNVVVRILPGNHDPHTSLALSIALAQFFSAAKRIDVDCSPSPFFPWTFGDVFVVANHGDRIKLADMPAVMAARWPENWGKAKHRYAYFGHVHHTSKGGGEAHGVTWESFQCLAPKDAWHAGEGYTAGRSMVAITLHKKFGERFRHIARPAY